MCGEVAACLEQATRAQEAADVVGAKRRLGAGGHRRLSAGHGRAAMIGSVRAALANARIAPADLRAKNLAIQRIRRILQ
jgi:hypothetical protein